MIMPLATQLINPCGFNINEQPVLVPIPGGPGLSHHIFRPNLDDVAKQIPVLYIDPLGTGQSPAPQTTASYIESCAQALLATLQQKEICSAVLYGHSSGAQIAAQAAVLDTHNRIEHIILSNPVLLGKQTMLNHWTALGGELAHKAIMDLDTNAIDQFMLEIAPLYDTVPRSLEHAMTLEFNKDILINYVQNLKNFSANFIQYDGQSIEEGMIYIGKDRIRVDYLNPSKITIVMAQDKAMYVSYDLREVQYFDPQDSPAGVFINIFKNNFFLDGVSIDIKNNNILLKKEGEIDNSKFTLLIFNKRSLDNSSIGLEKSLLIIICGCLGYSGFISKPTTFWIYFCLYICLFSDILDSNFLKRSEVAR